MKGHAREGSSLAVEWPDVSAARPAFPILDESAEAGRVDDALTLIVGTTAGRWQAVNFG
jgi:hypothetical protein